MKSFGVVLLALGLGLLVNQGLMYLNGDAVPGRAAWAEEAKSAPPEPTALEALGGLASLSGGAFLLLLDRERARGRA